MMADQHTECVVGFTGTREGMTQAQKDMVAALMDTIATREVHHGDCVGADADFHKIAQARGCRIVLHPPVDPVLRAWCDGDALPVKDYLPRNQDIIDACDVLIATPKEDGERYRGQRYRGGTWYTIRNARQQGRKLIIVWPDGSTQSDGGERGD